MKANFKCSKMFFLFCCLFSFGCQPDGGDLTPVLQSDAKIVSIQSKTDNGLQYDRENFSLKVAGNWESVKGDIDFTAELRNLSSRKITIDFNKTEIVNTLNANLKILSVVNRYTEGSSKIIENKIVEIGTGETQIYNIGVGEENRSYKGNMEYRGNEIQMIIPVTTEQNTTNYNFKFKYGNYLP